MNNTVKTYKSITGNRLVFDVVAPGFGAADIKVSKKTLNGGKDTILIVSGKYVRPTGVTGKKVPRFGFDKEIDATFKVELAVPALDYNADAVKFAVSNGVIRLTVPKTAAAIGVAIAPLAADGNVNIVDTGLDAATDDDDDNDE